MNSHSSRYECHLCNRNHQSKTHLRKHLKLKHSTDLDAIQPKVVAQHFFCEVCGKVYPSQPALHTHAKTHQRPEFECHFCSKKFVRKYVLMKHLISIHRTSSADLRCPQCSPGGRTFQSKIQLKDHINKVHSCKRFICELCFSQFKQKGSLNEHLRIHSGEKPFECLTCKKSFRTKTILKLHQVSHTDEKNFTCKYCPHRFTRKSSAKTHEKIHMQHMRPKNVNETPLKIQMEEQESRDSDYDY